MKRKYLLSDRQENEQMKATLKRVLASYEGCGCECRPPGYDEDNNPVEERECLSCEVRDLMARYSEENCPI